MRWKAPNLQVRAFIQWTLTNRISAINFLAERQKVRESISFESAQKIPSHVESMESIFPLPEVSSALPPAPGSPLLETEYCSRVRFSDPANIAKKLTNNFSPLPTRSIKRNVGGFSQDLRAESLLSTHQLSPALTDLVGDQFEDFEVSNSNHCDTSHQVLMVYC